MKLHVEIRPGEGGEDARSLVREQSAMYIRFCNTNGIRVDVVQESVG